VTGTFSQKPINVKKSKPGREISNGLRIAADRDNNRIIISETLTTKNALFEEIEAFLNDCQINAPIDI
jgi:hypothetical protein